MRKYLKKKLMSMMGTLEKAEHSLNGICQLKGGREECGSLLAEMQNCAIEMGEAIEDAEGEGTTSVALLEQYCELLWECLNAAPGPVRQRILKEIYRKRSAAKKQIQNEFSEVSEILFCPIRQVCGTVWKVFTNFLADRKTADAQLCRFLTIQNIQMVLWGRNIMKENSIQMMYLLRIIRITIWLNIARK